MEPSDFEVSVLAELSAFSDSPDLLDLESLLGESPLEFEDEEEPVEDFLA